MNHSLEPDLHWTEHFVKYGFAVLKRQVDREYIEAALSQVREYVGLQSPFDEWTADQIGALDRTAGDQARTPIFDAIYDQPEVRRLIEIMFGTAEVGAPNGWDGTRFYRLFINAYNPLGQAVLETRGYIDYGYCPIPVFGGGFMLQVALHDTEPFGGNTLIFPGTHRLVQKMVIDDSATEFPRDFSDFPFPKPFEFVAEAGDVLVFHHLAVHASSVNHGATRQSRIALHVHVDRTTWPAAIDPDDASLSPWERSLALNGRHEDFENERIVRAFFAGLTKSEPAAAL